MATSAVTFQQAWKIGRAVQEKSPPGKKGTIKARQGAGANARITVAFTGRPPQAYAPSQLTLL